MASQSTLIGAAGEHYILSELLRRGYIAALAPAGVPNADIVVSDIKGSRLCAIQVKTRRGVGQDRGWHMKDKHEKIREDRLFYCFVDFVDLNARPLVYVMPSTIVATAIASAHKKWLETPGKNGRVHKDGPMRRLLPDYSKTFGSQDNPYPDGWLAKYQDSWHLLGLNESDPERPAN